MPRTPRPVFRSRCTGRRTTCKAPLCRRRSTVSTLILKYSAAASRSSNRGPGPTKPDDPDERRDADKIRGAGEAATGSLLRARALSRRSWPAVSGPPSVPTSSLIGSPSSSFHRDSRLLGVSRLRVRPCQAIFAEADLIPLLPDPRTPPSWRYPGDPDLLLLRNGLRRLVLGIGLLHQLAQVLYPALERAGIPRVRRGSGLHLFRHSAASLVHKRTGSLKFAQALLRHARVSTTANVYTHVSPSESRGIAQALEESIFSNCSQSVLTSGPLAVPRELE